MALSTRYAELENAVISRAEITVPDPEFQRTNTYKGYVVQHPETGKYLGHLWKDDSHWCWRTLDASHFGRELKQRDAITQIVEHAR